MPDYVPDPLWSMATTPGETYQGWSNRVTKKVYDWLRADPARARNAHDLAADCRSSGRAWTQQRPGSAALDGQNDHTFAIAEFTRRLDLRGLIPGTLASPAALVHIHFEQLLDAFLED